MPDKAEKSPDFGVVEERAPGASTAKASGRDSISVQEVDILVFQNNF